MAATKKKKATRRKTTPKEWPASKTETRAIADLVPYARNARTHSSGQVKKIAASIEEWGWTNPVLVDEENGIIAGHGRILAAELLEIVEVPVIVARGWTDAQRRAYVLADNRLALDAGWDEGLLSLEFTELGELDFDLALTGFSIGEIGTIVSSHTRRGTQYAIKVETPIYEPTGEEPPVEELADDAKAAELLERVESADIPEEARDFLRVAAARHVRFDYGKIAEWYCHAPPEIQRLMEESALVIIDFDKAVEGGYVRVCERLRGIAGDALEAEAEE